MATTEEQFYAKNEMVNEPSKPCDFKVNDIVTFTNDYGVSFHSLRVIGFTKPEHEVNGRFIHIDSDSPWFPVKPESLKLLHKPIELAPYGFLHAWYSKNQSKLLGTSFYDRKDGSLVEITQVGNTPECHWPDCIYLGLVIKWIRSCD